MKHKAVKITLILTLSVLEVIQLTAIVLFFRLAFVRITPYHEQIAPEPLTMSIPPEEYEFEIPYTDVFFRRAMQDFTTIAPCRAKVKEDNRPVVFRFEDTDGGKHTFYTASLDYRDFFGLKLSVVNCDGKYYYAERQFCQAMDIYYEQYVRRYNAKMNRMKESPPETAE